jgi:hypothetical protein
MESGVTGSHVLCVGTSRKDGYKYSPLLSYQPIPHYTLARVMKPKDAVEQVMCFAAPLCFSHSKSLLSPLMCPLSFAIGNTKGRTIQPDVCLSLLQLHTYPLSSSTAQTRKPKFLDEDPVFCAVTSFVSLQTLLQRLNSEPALLSKTLKPRSTTAMCLAVH